MMISHLLQVGYVCYYLAKSNYSMNTISLQWKEIGFKYVESEHLLANWNTLFNKSIANWFIFTKVNILHFLAIKKREGKAENTVSHSVYSLELNVYFCFGGISLDGRTHAQADNGWLFKCLGTEIDKNGKSEREYFYYICQSRCMCSTVPLSAHTQQVT